MKADSFMECLCIHPRCYSLVLLSNCFLSSTCSTSPFIILCLTQYILFFQNEHYLFCSSFFFQNAVGALRDSHSVPVKLWRRNSPEPRKWLLQRALKSLWEWKLLHLIGTTKGELLCSCFSESWHTLVFLCTSSHKWSCLVCIFNCWSRTKLPSDLGGSPAG